VLQAEIDESDGDIEPTPATYQALVDDAYGPGVVTPGGHAKKSAVPPREQLRYRLAGGGARTPAWASCWIGRSGCASTSTRLRWRVVTYRRVV
jgi:hypothetical protein